MTTPTAARATVPHGTPELRRAQSRLSSSASWRRPAATAGGTALRRAVTTTPAPAKATAPHGTSEPGTVPRTSAKRRQSSRPRAMPSGVPMARAAMANTRPWAAMLARSWRGVKPRQR